MQQGHFRIQREPGLISWSWRTLYLQSFKRLPSGKHALSGVVPLNCICTQHKWTTWFHLPWIPLRNIRACQKETKYWQGHLCFLQIFFFGSGLLCLVKSMQTCSTGISRQTVSSPVPARVLPCPCMLTFKNYLRGKPALYGMETFITDATANLLS